MPIENCSKCGAENNVDVKRTKFSCVECEAENNLPSSSSNSWKPVTNQQFQKQFHAPKSQNFAPQQKSEQEKQKHWLTLQKKTKKTEHKIWC